ncbi:MAG: dephospho-CoA kinase [Verrucomicrobia bacterium]|nr:dephospho-CoA kinase [Verrucomicrobiota bacterium]
MKIGITGGVGCGKSTAAGMFELRGFRRLDSDRFVRDNVLTRSDIKAAIQHRFGPDVLAADGAVDRTRLAARVFTDEAALRWLEELTHPVLFTLWREAFAAEPQTQWAVEVPLLFEKKLENWFDFTVCVACSPTLQLARLEQRGMPRVLAEQRISQQLPLAQKIEQADFVLWNEGSAEFLQEQVDQLIASLTVVR